MSQIYSYCRYGNCGRTSLRITINHDTPSTNPPQIKAFYDDAPIPPNLASWKLQYFSGWMGSDDVDITLTGRICHKASNYYYLLVEDVQGSNTIQEIKNEFGFDFYTFPSVQKLSEYDHNHIHRQMVGPLDRFDAMLLFNPTGSTWNLDEWNLDKFDVIPKLFKNGRCRLLEVTNDIKNNPTAWNFPYDGL